MLGSNYLKVLFFCPKTGNILGGRGGGEAGQFGGGEVELFGGEASPAPPSLDETLQSHCVTPPQ